MLKGTGSWMKIDQKCCLLASFALWPLAFDPPSHAHCLFCPILSSKHGRLIPMVKSHVAKEIRAGTL